MEFYTLNFSGLTRQLPIISLGPKIRIASFNLLGDVELVKNIAQDLAIKLAGVEFDYLVGPEVKVVPLLQTLSQKLNKERYIVCRKQIHGYMSHPITTPRRPGLVINGTDANLLVDKKVVILDDVVSTGETMKSLKDLIESVGAVVVKQISIFKQGEAPLTIDDPIIFLGQLPLF